MLSPFAHMPLVPTQEFPSMLWSAQTVTRPSSSRLTLHILSPQSGISYTPTPSDCQQPPNSHEVILLLKPSSSPGCGISPLLIWYVCVCVYLCRKVAKMVRRVPLWLASYIIMIHLS